MKGINNQARSFQRPALPEAETATIDETLFTELLRRFQMKPLQKPIDLLIKSFKFESLTAEFESEKEENQIVMLVEIELKKMIDQLIPVEDGVKNITMILTKSNIKEFNEAISKNRTRIKKISQKYAIVLPKEELWLHKTGKILKNDVLRPCFVTNDAFGQISGSKKSELVKPVYFRDQEVIVQAKSEVSLKSKNEVSLKWPDKKEISGFGFRTLFTHNKTGKTIAIYFKTENICINLKNSTIIKKISDKNLVNKILNFRTIWKIVKIENFYRRRLKKFFGDTDIIFKLEVEEEKVTNLIDNYMKANFPNLYLSNTEPQGVFSFVNKTYLHAEETNKERPLDVMKAEVIKKQFATLINPEMYQKPDSSQISLNKKRIAWKSPFSELAQPIMIIETQMIDNINLLRIESKTPAWANAQLKQMFENYTSCSKMLLKFNRVIIENVFNRSDYDFLENDINDIIFDIEASVEKGTFHSKSISFVNQVHKTYLTLNFSNSFKVDYNSLKFIKIRIVNRSSKIVVFDQVLSLQDKLSTLLFENPIIQEVEFPYKGVPLKCLLCFVVFLIPKNLEMAHTLLTPTLLKLNFEKFEQIVKKSDTYNEFFDLFYDDALLGQAKGNYFDLMSFTCQYYPIFASTLVKQQNMFFKSFGGTNLDSLKVLLKNLINDDLRLIQLLLKTNDMMRTDEKLGSFVCYDLLTKASEMLSVKERYMVQQMIFNYVHAMFVNLDPRSPSLGYNKPVIARIIETLRMFWESNPHIRFHERILIQFMTMQTYLYLENNSLLKMNFKIGFLVQYIPIIANITLINQQILDRSKLLMMIIHAILSTINIKNYSEANHIIYLDSLIIFFKLAMKNIASENYCIIRNLFVDFETLFMGYLVNSFAKVLSPIYYTIYQDFKQVLFLITILKSKSIPILQNLENLDINFNSMIDLLFIVSIINNNIDFIRVHITYRNFASIFNNLIVKEAANLKASIMKILQYLDYLCDRDLFATKFKFHKENIREYQTSKATSVKNVFLNIKALKIDSKVVEKILLEEIEKNVGFGAKVQSLFECQKEDKEKRDIIAFSNCAPKIDYDYINEDIYFEVFEGIEDIESKSDLHERENMPKHISSAIYLNNLNYGYCNSLFYNQVIVSDLNNIHELNGEETISLLTKYVSGSQILKMEIFQDLANIGKTKNVPLLRLLVALVLGSSESEDLIKKGLVFMAKALTKIVYPEENDKLLNKMVGYIMAEVYMFYPVQQFPLFLNNKVDSQDKDLYFGIKIATIDLHEEIIDLTDICAKHFASSTFLFKRPSILFGKHFCNDLVLVLNDLKTKKIIGDNIKKFELALEFHRNGQVEFFNFPFVVEITDKIAIVCKYSDTIYFNDKISNINLISETVIPTIFDDSSFMLLNNSVAYKLNLNFVGKSVVLKFSKFDLALKVMVNFVDGIYSELITSLMPWSFRTDDARNKTKFEVAEINIDIEIYSFFLVIEDFIQFVIQKCFERVAAIDFPKLIRMNSESYEISSNAGKAIDPRNYFYDLVEYERSLTKNQPLILNVEFIEKA